MRFREMGSRNTEVYVSNKQKGRFFLVYEGIFPDFGNEPFTYREAWLWLIGHVGFTNGDMGILTISKSELAREWNWMYQDKNRNWRSNTKRVTLFLDKMELLGRLSMGRHRVATGSPPGRHQSSHNIIIKITNYATYQRREIEEGRHQGRHRVATGSPPGRQTPPFPKEDQNVTSPLTLNTNIRTKNITKSITPKKLTKPKNKKEVEKRLRSVDQTKFYTEFGADFVASVWTEFKDTCLEGTAKKPVFNPYDYVNFSRGFRTFLKRAQVNPISIRVKPKDDYNRGPKLG